MLNSNNTKSWNVETIVEKDDIEREKETEIIHEPATISISENSLSMENINHPWSIPLPPSPMFDILLDNPEFITISTLAYRIHISHNEELESIKEAIISALAKKG